MSSSVSPNFASGDGATQSPPGISLTEAIDLIYARTGQRLKRVNVLRMSRAGCFPPLSRASKKAEPMANRQALLEWVAIVYDEVLRNYGPTIDCTPAAAAVRISEALKINSERRPDHDQ